MLDRYENDFRDYAAIYAKTKRLILRSEQIDPESRSNIAVFKEQRDAHDHLMRAIAEIAKGDAHDTDYVRTHFDKARGHVFRAAYDALEGIGISCKVKLHALQDIPTGAFTAVYPEYWKDILKFDKIDEEIIERRNSKDIGRDTLENLEKYERLVEELYTIHHAALMAIPALEDWARRYDAERERDASRGFRWKGKDYLAYGLVGGVVLAMIVEPLKRFFSSSATTAPAVSTNQVITSTTNVQRSGKP